MKKNLLTLTAVSSLLLSATTLASESADIKVIGEITTASCEVTMGNNGIFDFGKISQAKLSESANTLLGSSNEGSVHVKCSAPTPLTFTTTDNRLGTATFLRGGHNFGLGSVNGSGKLGFYSLELSEPTVDGIVSRMFTASDSGAVGMTFDAVGLEYGKRFGWAPISGAKEMVIGKDFAFKMSAKAYLSAKSDMNGDLGEDVSLDGSATMEFGFGL